jgi:hypothetical protein
MKYLAKSNRKHWQMLENPPCNPPLSSETFISSVEDQWSPISVDIQGAAGNARTGYGEVLS